MPSFIITVTPPKYYMGSVTYDVVNADTEFEARKVACEKAYGEGEMSEKDINHLTTVKERAQVLDAKTGELVE